jgi:hypothetical protein
MDVDEKWEQFMNGDEISFMSDEPEKCVQDIVAPEASELVISTKSKIVFLNRQFDLNQLFWKIKTINYNDEKEGVIKKQMKFNFLNQEEVNYFEKMIQYERNIKIKILNQINNPTGRVTFKDVRKVDVGFCKNDVTKPKKESKSAFYNCFVIIFRKFYKGMFREFHVKLFNSGKVEIPGIQSDDMLQSIVDILISILQPHFDDPIEEIRENRELVLVNSNFNCNFY